MTELEKFLISYKGKSIILGVTGGNRGDGLIQKGIDYIFDKYNVKIQRQHLGYLEENAHFKELWLNGCGGYCKNWNASKLLEKCNKIADKVIVLPSTFDTSHPPVEDALKSLKSNTIVFCRDIISYKNVKNLELNFKVYLSPDTAFYFLKDYKSSIKGKGTLYAFRKDKEKSSISIPPENYDISFGNPTQWDVLIREVEKYETVHTNYGHVGMLASMLGKKTFIYPGNYFKNRGFYEYMLKDNKNTVFVTEDKLKDKKLLYLIKSRRSIRKYKDIKINKEDLTDLIEAGIFAPSGCNTQNQRFVIITNKEDIKFIATKRTNEVATANAIILYYSDNTKCVYNLKGKHSTLGDLPYYDCGASIQNILLLAEAKGLNACWFIMHSSMKGITDINKRFNIASNFKIMAMVALGYKDEEVNYHTGLHQKRKIKRNSINKYILNWKE